MNSILIVEDHQDSALLLAVMLSKQGYTCETAANGAEALERYNPDLHKIVLLDIQLPDITGYEVLKSIRQKQDNSAATIVVAQTAKVTEHEKEYCLGLGFDDYLSKPISYTLLKSKLPEWDTKSGHK